MNESLPYYVDELYSRAYYLFLQASSLRQMTGSSFMTEEQKLALAESQIEALTTQAQGFVDRSQEIYDHFYPEEPEP